MAIVLILSMIIISDLRGQLCNRIFLTAYGLALSEKAGQRFVDFSLDKYAQLFPATRRSKWLEPFYKFTRYAVRALVKMLWLLPGHPLVIDVTWKTLRRMRREILTSPRDLNVVR